MTSNGDCDWESRSYLQLFNTAHTIVNITELRPVNNIRAAEKD